MIRFDKDTHTYEEDGRTLISVTQLMRKHGLAPDYSDVPEEILKAKAERGTIIHKEIEEWIKQGTLGITEEAYWFAEWAKRSNTEIVASEFIAHNDIVAGTCDLMLAQKGKPIIADIKTTAKLHKDSVSWQLSIYNELMGWPTDKGMAIHLTPDGLKAVEIPLKKREEVEELLECERKGERYLKELTISQSDLEAIERAQLIIEEADRRMKEAKETLKAVNEAIIQAMKEAGVKKFENDRIRITYVEGTDRTTIDSARLKKEKPEIAEEYSKTSKTADSIRVTIKEEAE